MKSVLNDRNVEEALRNLPKLIDFFDGDYFSSNSFSSLNKSI